MITEIVITADCGDYSAARTFHVDMNEVLLGERWPWSLLLLFFCGWEERGLDDAI